MNKFLYIVFISLFLFGCKSTDKKVHDEPVIMEGNAYGSTFKIVYYAENNHNTDIEEILHMFDASVNTYIEDSYLTKFNHSVNGSAADGMLLQMIDLAKEYNRQTQAYYDPSVAPLSHLWGFSKTGLQHTPTDKQVDSVLAFVGLQHLKIKNDSVLKDDARFEMNFNSMTGFVNDQIGEFFKQHQVENYMIEIGGEVLAHGQKLDGDFWTIGIDEPNENQSKRTLNAVVKLKNEALATSGNYRKFFIDKETGRKIVHTMNPQTGYPETSALLSATVIAPTCAEADAIATALMAMGYEKALSYIPTRKDLQFYLIWSDENGIFQSKGFNGFQVVGN